MSIAEIKARWAAATSGPWEWEYPAGVDQAKDFPMLLQSKGATLMVGLEDKIGIGTTTEEAIAHAPQDIAELLALVERCKKTLARVVEEEEYSYLGDDYQRGKFFCSWCERYEDDNAVLVHENGCIAGEVVALLAELEGDDVA